MSSCDSKEIDQFSLIENGQTWSRKKEANDKHGVLYKFTVPISSIIGTD
jgi:hypothetical protein